MQPQTVKVPKHPLTNGVPEHLYQTQSLFEDNPDESEESKPQKSRSRNEAHTIRSMSDNENDVGQLGSKLLLGDHSTLRIRGHAPQASDSPCLTRESASQIASPSKKPSSHVSPKQSMSSSKPQPEDAAEPEQEEESTPKETSPIRRSARIELLQSKAKVKAQKNSKVKKRDRYHKEKKPD